MAYWDKVSLFGENTVSRSNPKSEDRIAMVILSAEKTIPMKTNFGRALNIEEPSIGSAVPGAASLTICMRSDAGTSILTELNFNVLIDIDNGAPGVDMGRNVFQSKAPSEMIHAERAVVHEKLTTALAFKLRNDLKSK